jgi:hypothetical protein
MVGSKRRAARWSALAIYGVLVPLGLVLRVTTDPLRQRRRPPETNWQPVPEQPPSLDRARRLA